MEVEVLIVGFGLAGATLAHSLEARGISFCIVEDSFAGSASCIAAGLVTPLTGKRFVKTWRFDEIAPIVNAFYPSIERKLSTTLWYQIPQIKVCTNDFEAQQLQKRSIDPEYTEFLGASVELPSYIHQPYGAVTIEQTSILQSKNYIETSFDYFSSKGVVMNQRFAYEDCTFSANSVTFHDITARYVVDCTGYAFCKTSYGSSLGLEPSKGEILTLRTDVESLPYIINAGLYVIPLGNYLYRVGATYGLLHDTTEPTEEAKLLLTTRFSNLWKGTYEVVAHDVGIRPKVPDKHPIIGKVHPDYPIYSLNSLGAKGVSYAPWAAKLLIEHIFEQQPIDKELDATRYQSK
jgi:glycine oxidase